ncbi:MAG: carboxypeptidase-like regulatory domain-containing protein [Vicinamibacterales bacterium]
MRTTGTIAGTVLRSDNSPVINGLLRLRNIASGEIVMGTRSDATGRFDFVAVPPASYVVELVDGGGRVRAVGQMFSVGRGEAITTLVRLGTEDRWLDGFFGNAAAAVVAAAASLGVTAVGNGAQPASPRF